MIGPILYDAVTLRHFGAIGRLDILQTRHGNLPPPRWAQAVFDEIVRAEGQGNLECETIRAAAWLLEPVAPQGDDMAKVLRIQIGLNDGQRPPTAHAGEAESIYFAEKLEGRFVTDDNEAYDFATRRLGAGRVYDTVDVLRDAVAMDDLTPAEAYLAANAIRNCNRSLRRIHPSTFPHDYF
jgi:hypothetical protein